MSIESVSNRIFKNWKTTTLSVIIMATFGAALWYDKVSWGEWSVAMGAAVAFLFMRDKPKDERKAKHACEKAIDDQNADN